MSPNQKYLVKYSAPPFHLLLLLLISCAHAMTVQMGQYLLEEGEVGTKARYVYSDFQDHPDQKILKNATIEFDLGMYDINYDFAGNVSGAAGENTDANATDETRSFLRLYIILANSQQLNSLMQTIEMNKDFLDKYGLTYQYLFKPMRKEWAVY